MELLHACSAAPYFLSYPSNDSTSATTGRVFLWCIRFIILKFALVVFVLVTMDETIGKSLNEMVFKG